MNAICYIGGSAALIGLWVWLATRGKTKSGPVYMKCKDCGREHAVYQDGNAVALRSLEEVENSLRQAANQPGEVGRVGKKHLDEFLKQTWDRRPGIED